MSVAQPFTLGLPCLLSWREGRKTYKLLISQGAESPVTTKMNKTKHKSFILYADLLEKFRGLNDAQLGQLFKSILMYVNGQEVVIDDPVTRLAFDVVRVELDKNEQKYQQITEKRKQAGSKHRGNQHTKKQNGTNQASVPTSSKNGTNGTNVPSVPKLEQMEQVGTNGTDNDNVNVNDNDNLISNKFEMAKAISPQAAQGEENLGLDSQQPSPPAPPPRPDKRSPQIENIMTWFEATYGFPPTDRKPRFRAHNLTQRMRKFCQECGKDPTPERIGKAISQFLDWYADNQYHDGTQTLDTVVRKFEVWKAEVLERRKESVYA